MNVFRDLFGSRRRTNPRVPVRWFVDLQLPVTEQFVGFFTCDVSLLGLRLVGENSEAFQRTLNESGIARMRLRFPDRHQLLPLVEAELKWGIGPDGNFQTGWRFTSTPEEVEELLQSYIEAHADEALSEGL